MTDEDMIDLVIAAQYQANLVLDRLIQLKDDPHKIVTGKHSNF